MFIFGQNVSKLTTFESMAKVCEGTGGEMLKHLRANCASCCIQDYN